MKRRDLERHLRQHGCHFDVHGGNHDIWRNPKTKATSPVPRHNELNPWTAAAICRQLQVPVLNKR